MGFPLVLLNVFLFFAVAAALACYGFALIPILRARMRTMTRVPVLLGLVAAIYDLYRGETVTTALVALVVTAVGSSMLLAFVYGWTKKSQFDAADMEEGIGRFGPVMVVWTSCLLFVAVVALVNTAKTGSAIPFRHPFPQ